MASHEDMCQVCFEKKKCRTKYIGRAGLFVCSNPACLATNLERRKVAKELALAEKAAKKKALDEAKAKARAKKMLAKARSRPAVGRASRKPAKTKATLRDLPFFQDQDEVDDRQRGEDLALELDAAPMLEKVVTPSRARPARHAARPGRFIDEAAGASDDGVEEEEEGDETPRSMRDFVEEDHLSEEGASDARERRAARGTTPLRTPLRTPNSILVTPTSDVPTSVRPGMRRPRFAISPGSQGTPGGSRAAPDSAYGRRPRARRPRIGLSEDEEDHEEEDEEVWAYLEPI